MKNKILATLVFVLIAVVFAVKSFAGVDPYNAYQNRMQLYTSNFYLTIDSLDGLTRKLDSLITGQNADTAAVQAALDSITATHTAVGAVKADTKNVRDSLLLVSAQATAIKADTKNVRDSLLLVAAQITALQSDMNLALDSLKFIYALVDTAAFRGNIPLLSAATSLPSETTDTIGTVTGEVAVYCIGFRVTTALAAEYIKLGFWATNTDGAAASTALCDSAGMTDLTGSAAGVSLNLTGVFANNPTVTAFNVAAVSGMPTVMRLKNCVITVGSGTAVTASGKVRYFIWYVPIDGGRITLN